MGQKRVRTAIGLGGAVLPRHVKSQQSVSLDAASVLMRPMGMARLPTSNSRARISRCQPEGGAPLTRAQVRH